MFNMGNMMKQMGELNKIKKEMKKLKVDGTSRSGDVVLVMNGEMKLLDVQIKEGVSIKEIERGVKEAHDQAMAAIQQKTIGQLQGFNIPGLG